MNDEAQKRYRDKFKHGRAENADYFPAKETQQIFNSGNEMRVAVYARVSTASEQQMSSQVMQEEYYSEFVERQEGWKLVRIYADPGISGTSLNHRDQFKQMIEDCKSGGIDLIVVKSVSRFARNVKDGTDIIDMLASLNPPVGVWFENERIYSLSSDNEFPLHMLMSVAAEESRAKSVAMVSSLKMRMSHGILLIPPLLGYDHDAEAENLVINESEAPIVRLAFCMCVRGYATARIAELFITLGLRTKRGSLNWTAGSVLGILQNERCCGQVLTWKYFTPNYKNHRPRKNRGEREQYLYHGHHPAIVSESDFYAVQKIIENTKFGARSFMPKLRVISGGLLHGFVSVNPRWVSFRQEDYRAASESAGAGEVSIRPAAVKARKGSIDWRGYQVVRSQFMSAVNAVTLTVAPGGTRERNGKKITLPVRIRLSGACVRRLCNSEYAELLVHPGKNLAAVRACGQKDKNALRWADCGGGTIHSRGISGAAFGEKLYALFGLTAGNKYRFRGTVDRAGNETVVLFNMSEPELLSNEGTVFPAGWSGGFGKDYYEAMESAKTRGKAKPGGEAREYDTLPQIIPSPREELDKTYDELLRLFQKTGSESNG